MIRQHSSHPAIITRLKRAERHLRHVIGMIEAGRRCTEVAIQLQAVERVAATAKRVLIHDHIDHCLGRAGASDRSELHQLAKLL